jgi:Predicted Fe-S oxidoreductases
VITGGEPLVRPDILDIARHAVKLGFMVVFGTNGMLIDDRMAKDLVDIGVMGMGISIDSLDPQNTIASVACLVRGKPHSPASRPASETGWPSKCTSVRSP